MVPCHIGACASTAHVGFPTWHPLYGFPLGLTIDIILEYLAKPIGFISLSCCVVSLLIACYLVVPIGSIKVAFL